MQKGQLVRHRIWSVAGLVVAAGAVLLVGATTPAVADPPRPVSASEVIGCCVCRGTSGGTATTLRSCSDGVKVDACVTECKGQNADSVLFGYQQTCSQGCAGFPTQSLQ
jgi:hypothetical protein